MDRLGQRQRSRESREEFNAKRENSYEGKSTYTSNPQEQNLHQYQTRYTNSPNQIQNENKLGFYNKSNQSDLYNQMSPSAQKKYEQTSQDRDDYLSDQLEDVQSDIQNQQQLEKNGIKCQYQFDNNQQQQKTGSFKAQKKSNGEQSNETIPFQIEQNEFHNREKNNSNYFKANKTDSLYQQNYYDDQDENKIEMIQKASKYDNKYSFDNKYLKDDQSKNNQSDHNECNLDELIVGEEVQQVFDSKDQSYDYSKGSSPEKNLKESTNSGIQNFNSYQQKHRLLQKRSHDEPLSVQQQQQPFLQNNINNPISSIKYNPYQHLQQQQQLQNLSRNYNNDNSPSSYPIHDQRDHFNHDFNSNSNKKQLYSNEKSQKQQNTTESQDRKRSLERKYIQDEQSQQQTNRNNNSMFHDESELKYQENIELQEKLREKDLILGQMREFTVQLQNALEQQQDKVVNLKNENKILIAQLSDCTQPTFTQQQQQISEQNQLEQQNSQYIETRDMVQRNKKQNEKQIGQLEEDSQQTDMLISTDAKYQPQQNQEKQLKSPYMDERGDQYNEQEQTDDVKKRFNLLKNSTNMLKSIPVEQELYRQIDNLNEIIDQLRHNNILLEEENRSLIQSNHLVNQEANDLKYRLNSEIEILTNQNRKLMLSHRIQQDNYDYTNQIYELNYKLETMQSENEQLILLNNQQLDDIKILLSEKDSLNIKVVDLTKQLEHRGLETSRRYEQLKFDLAREYEQKSNEKILEIHYKSHQQIEKYKQKLKKYEKQQEVGNFPQNKQNNFMATSNINQNPQQHLQTYNNPSGNATYNGQNINKIINSQNENNNILNDPSNIYPQKQFNNTYQLSNNNTNNNISQWNQTQQIKSKQPITRSSSDQDINERRVVWEICGILRNEQIETLPKIIADMKDQSKSLTKFTDCIIQMVVSCHPTGYFGNQQPTLKYSWKWLKQIMEEYMSLKSQQKDVFEQQICSMLQVNNKMDAVSILGDKLIECTIANRVFKKISHILNLKQFNSFIEFEQAIEQLEKEDMASPDKIGDQ